MKLKRKGRVGVKLHQKVYHDQHGEGEVVRKEKSYFWVRYDKYEELLIHEQKEVGRSVKLKSKSTLKPQSTLKPISKKERKSKILNLDPNWKSNNDITYLGKM